MDTTQSQQKRIRSMPPDVTVVVGIGDNQQEFECYKPCYHNTLMQCWVMICWE